MSEDKHYNATIEHKGSSMVEIEGEIAAKILEKHRKAAVTALGKKVKIDGFREGHVPENILVEKVGEMNLLTEMAERALRDVYPKIIHEHALEVVGHPEISITKIAAGNPLGFKARVATMPKVKLPDYRAIAQKQEKESAEVTEKELDEAIENILRQKIAYERLQKKAAKKAETENRPKDGVIDLPTPETALNKEDEPITPEEDPKKLPLPELTDEYVKELGPFEHVDDFKTKLKTQLQKDKEQEVTGKHRAAITDTIIASSEIDLPEIMIDAELGQIEAQMQEDLKRANLTMEDYLGHIKKTKEELVAEWKPAAEKRAKLQLVLNEIAKQEKIKPEREKVEREVEHLKEHYKDADPERLRIYVESILRNDAVIHMLESLDKS